MGASHWCPKCGLPGGFCFRGLRSHAALKSAIVSDWVNRPSPAPTSAELEKRRRLWEALSAWVSQHGGWFVSLPGNREIRIEIPQGSSIPARLQEFGFFPRHCGTSTRITGTGTTETIVEHSSGEPIIRHHSGFVPVDILEITLGG